MDNSYRPIFVFSVLQIKAQRKILDIKSKIYSSLKMMYFILYLCLKIIKILAHRKELTIASLLMLYYFTHIKTALSQLNQVVKYFYPPKITTLLIPSSKLLKSYVRAFFKKVLLLPSISFCNNFYILTASMLEELDLVNTRRFVHLPGYIIKYWSFTTEN